MEYSEKMMLVPLNSTLPDNCKDVLKKALKLCLLGYVNDRLNVKINGSFKEDTNIIDYLLDNKQQYSTEFEQIVQNIERPIEKPKLYTTVAPVNKKNTNWVYS